MTEAEAIVQRQLEAYNARDLEAFLACYADDAKLWRAPDTITESGKEALRARYRRRFDGAPALHATILARIVFDRFVVDHERVTGVPEGVLETVVTYEVIGDRIVNAWFLVP
jgi:uncharacterized protein (TIGR02246 family)